jgi:hypothetical protein
VKLRTPLGCLAVVCVTITGCDTKSPTQFNAARNLQSRIEQIAGQANSAAPTAVDPDTRLDGAKAGPGLRLTVMYTLVNPEANGVNAGTLKARLAPTVTESSCANPDLRPVIDQGVVVALEYRDLRGVPLGTVSIDRATCGAR